MQHKFRTSVTVLPAVSRRPNGASAPHLSAVTAALERQGFDGKRARRARVLLASQDGWLSQGVPSFSKGCCQSGESHARLARELQARTYAVPAACMDGVADLPKPTSQTALT